MVQKLYKRLAFGPSRVFPRSREKGHLTYGPIGKGVTMV